jgi:hypothetical protein
VAHSAFWSRVKALRVVWVGEEWEVEVEVEVDGPFEFGGAGGEGEDGWEG